jgi:hypothetical protein
VKNKEPSSKDSLTSPESEQTSFLVELLKMQDRQLHAIATALAGQAQALESLCQHISVLIQQNAELLGEPMDEEGSSPRYLNQRQ